MAFDLEAEGERLRRRSWTSTASSPSSSREGAGLDAIVAEREAAGETVKRDAFGHVKIDTINVGNWFSSNT